MKCQHNFKLEKEKKKKTNKQTNKWKSNTKLSKENPFPSKKQKKKKKISKSQFQISSHLGPLERKVRHYGGQRLYWWWRLTMTTGAKGQQSHQFADNISLSFSITFLFRFLSLVCLEQTKTWRVQFELVLTFGVVLGKFMFLFSCSFTFKVLL